ncbi:MAG: zinc-binding dehydrogenase [Actinobacteria bacterium]|nr:zinc-binding dehydrogenase [Actinomycetota bacterium]
MTQTQTLATKRDRPIIAVMPEPGKPLELLEVPYVEPGPGELVVEVIQANICGSDLHLWRGEMAQGFPRDCVLGHEMVGRIVDIGEEASSDSAGKPLAVGDTITYRYYEPCGHCLSCARGLYHHCPGSLASVLRPASKAPRLVGAFATHYLVTAGRSRFKLPDECTPGIAAGANCALSQVIQGFHEVGLRSDEIVVVQGCGGLGLYAIAVAKSWGASYVIAIDRSQARCDLARAFGADSVIDAGSVQDPKERTKEVMELTSGWGGDVVVEVVGRASVVPEGIRMVARGGRYLELGSIVPRDTVSIDISILVGYNRSILGVSLYQDRSLMEALDFLAKTEAPVHTLVGKTYPLEEVNEALKAADALQHEGLSVGRVGITPTGMGE